MQEDLEVTGISRSGRVRKKSSKLMDFESPDDIEPRGRRQTPVKPYVSSGFRTEEPQDYGIQESAPPKAEDAGTASGSESDYYENNVDNAERGVQGKQSDSLKSPGSWQLLSGVNNLGDGSPSMESDSSGSDEGTARTPANSLYMMEKSKKKLIVKDGRIVGRAKAQRKDKGKTRITAYMMWAKEARNELLRKHPDMDFSAISKRLGEMWSNVNYNERYLWKRKAKRFAIQKEQTNQSNVSKIISNQNVPVPRPVGHAGPGRPPTRAPRPAAPATTPPQALVPVSAMGGQGMYRVAGCGALEVAAHLRLLGESLAIIGDRLKEHEGQIAVSGSVSVLLDTLLCSLAPLLGVCRSLPAIAPPAPLLQDTLHNIAYIMPGL